MAMPGTPVGPLEKQDRAATRRLCAGVYVDAHYRTAVIQHVYNARRRRAAPSYGFDLIPVLSHAWRAWRLSVIEDTLLLVTVGMAFALVPLAALLATATLAVLTLLAVSFARLSSRFSSLRKADDEEEEEEEEPHPGLTGKSLVRGLCASLLLTVLTLIILVHTRGARGLLMAAVVALALCATLSAIGVLRQLALNRLRRQADSESPMRTSQRLSAIDAQQRHPVVVYSGTEPFIGSGRMLRTWSFAQRLVKAKDLAADRDEEFTEKPFLTWEIVEELRRAISALGTEEDPETRLPGIKVDDSLFVEGRYAQSHASELAAPPGDDFIRRMLNNPPETARHYLTCQVESWGGDVVTTIFVHVSLQGRTLYIEFTICGLAPTRLEYHIVDVVGGTGRMAVLRAAARSLQRLPQAALAPVRLLTASALLLQATRAGMDSTAESLKRGFDIGAVRSAREMAAIAADESYFQTFDVSKHSKVIERRLLATVGEFLKSHEVDTTEFMQRATAILNNGIINMGSGSVNVSDTAMGQETSVTK
ncbi:hypothetical protein [Streptomyces sp. DSM 118878]